jgi:glycine/sarcosine N-methyltransferase
VQRARRECAAAGVHAGLLVADMRTLPLAGCCADAVVCADNALPHLLADSDVLAALAQMNRVLRPGGTVIVSTRDYERVLADRPASTLPQVFTSGGARVISFQLWAWRGESDIYDLEHFQVHEAATVPGLSSAGRPATGPTLAPRLPNSPRPRACGTSGGICPASRDSSSPS